MSALEGVLVMQKYLRALLLFLLFPLQIVTDLEPSRMYKITHMQSELPLKKLHTRNEFSLYCYYESFTPFVSLSSTFLNLLILFAFYFHKINEEIYLYPKTNQHNWTVTSLAVARLACSLT